MERLTNSTLFAVLSLGDRCCWWVLPPCCLPRSLNRSVLQKCRVSCTSLTLRTPIRTQWMDIWMLAIWWNSSICLLRLSLLMRVVQGNARQRYLDHFLIELTHKDSSRNRHLPTQHVLGVIISNCFFSCPCAQQSPSLKLGQNCCGNGYLGQTDTPRREAWDFVFPRNHYVFPGDSWMNLRRSNP